MQTRDETHERLLLELAELRQRVAELEASKEERQCAEKALEQERHLLRTVIDNLPDYIYVKDAQSRFVTANAAVARVMGVAAPNLLVGKTDREFYPEQLAAKFQRDEERLLCSGEPLVNEDEQLVDAAGNCSAILTTKVPLRDAQGNVVGLVGIGRDITARQQAEESLRRAHADLEARVAERTAALARANEKLTREMADHERTEQVLRDSEALYASLVESLPVHVLRKDLAGRFVFANRSFCELVGKPLAEIVGKTDFDLYPAALAHKFRDDDRRVVETGRLFETVEENLQHGEPRQVQVMKSPVRDAAGQIVGVQVVFWDVTERTRAEAALQLERYLLHSLMDNLPHRIYFKDAASQFLRINRALATAFGLQDAADALGKSDMDFFTEEHARQAMTDEQEILRTGRPVWDKEEKETWPDGHITWAATTKMPLRDEAGRIVGTFGISRDITDWKQAAEALHLAKEAAEAANRAKSIFLANMSHEIRTPLNAVIGMTELVLSTSLAPQQKEFLTAVRDSGEALLSVINDILDFSKIEAGRIVLDRAPFDLWESLGDTMKSFAFRAHTQGLELAFHIAPDVPRMFVGDYSRLRQIIVNLVGNALKFTEQGEVVLTVQRETSGGGGRGSLALHRRRHRDRHSPGQTGHRVRGVRTGRQQLAAAARRHGAGADDLVSAG
jgi:PAS domain S-box-containing protein